MNYNKLISNARKTADCRKKAFTELKKAAPEIFRQYAEIMKGLGYSAAYFYGKLFHDQAEFKAHYHYLKSIKSSLMFDFEKLKFIEGTHHDWESKNMEIVYDGKEYELEFMKNTNGLVLLDFLDCIPDRINKGIEDQKKTIKKIDKIIHS